VERVYWETEPSTYIEIPSCRVGEFPKVFDFAVKLLESTMGGSEERAREIAREILVTWGIERDLEKITENDIWNILLAKAGKAKREILEKLPELASEMVVDFFAKEGMEGLERIANSVIVENTENSNLSGKNK